MRQPIWISLCRAIGLAAALTLCHPAAADGYPSKPIRLVLPFSPGGTTDQIGRIVATGLSKALNTTVVSENRPGAGGTIGATFVVNSAKDGYTLLLGTATSIANARNLYKSLPYDAEKDFAPISLIGHAPSILLVNNDVPAHSVKEFIDLARQPGSKMTFASTGMGSVQFMFGMVFNKLAGTHLLHIPYKGGAEAGRDVMAGRVSMVFDTAPSALTSIRTGKVRALAVTADEHLDALPDVPPITESLKGFPSLGWYGILAPAGTPDTVVAKLNKALVHVLQDPQTIKAFSELGVILLPGTPEAFSKQIKEDLAAFGALSKAYGIQAQ